MTNSEYTIKRAAIEEYKQVLKYKKVYEDLIESFRSIVTDLFQYADKHRIDLSNRERINRNIEKAGELIEYRISMTEGTTRNKTPDDSTEPKIV